MLLHKWNQRDFLGKCLHLGYEKSDYVVPINILTVVVYTKLLRK